MRILHFIIAAAFLAAACSPTKTIEAVDLLVTIPIPQMVDGQLKTPQIRDTLHLFFYQDYVIYQFPSDRNFENESRMPGTETWFVYRKNTERGNLYNASLTAPVSYRVDSLLFQRAFGKPDFKLESNEKLASRQVNEHITEEKYYFTNKGKQLCDTAVFYYDPTLHTDYSLSRQLDSSHGMKVSKVRLIVNKSAQISQQEYVFELRAAQADKSKILKLISETKKRNL